MACRRHRFLFNNVTEVLERLASRAPLMVVLEDIQWADGATLLLVEHLARRVAQMPLLILATYRHTELDPGSALARTLEELRRTGSSYSSVLRPLDIAETAAMLLSLTGREVPASAVVLIHGAGNGNPFFTEELFRHMAEEGLLVERAGSWHFVPAAAVSVPPGVQLVIERRLCHLAAGMRRERPGMVAGACRAGAVLVLAYLGEQTRCRAMLSGPWLELPPPGRPRSLGQWTGLPCWPAAARAGR